MNSSPTFQGSSRWGFNSIQIDTLHGATSDDQFELHLAAIEYELSAPITIETKDDILSRKHWSGLLEPYEHQVRNLITFCRLAPVALFADDVGLGKTISAGLVLNELQTRTKVRRALILCPKMLLHQWKDELEKYFGIHAAHGVGNNLIPWLDHAVPVVITTYESASARMDKIRAASFDMLILDEAHKLRNLHGSAKPPILAKALHNSLSNRDFKYVLLLTATPIQNRLWDMYSLIDCLSAAKGHVNPLGSPIEFVQRYVADGGTTARKLRPSMRDDFRRIVQHYMVRTSRKDARLVFPVRHVMPVQCQASVAEMSLQHLVRTAFEKLNALARTSLAEALMSSPRALIAQVRRMSVSGTISLPLLQSFENGIQAAGAGCKLDKLYDILEALNGKNPGKWRAIVFTRRLETLDLICEGLKSKGIQAGTIRGSGDATNQKSIKSFTSDPPLVNVLVSTDAGAVGLNLQVCNVVINFDLPWNPMVLEQRIGRVQRLGSRFQHIEVLNLTVKDSVEDHIVARLLSKLQLISSTIGDIEAILEASTFDDDEHFEAELRTLVTRALLGHDVNAALFHTQESIRKAKEIYDNEREQVEVTLGGMDELHRSGPVVPKLKPRQPRLGVQAFCIKAFTCEGATLSELPYQRIRVSPPGRAAWTATFNDNDPDLLRARMGAFGGTSIHLYQEGSRAFEGLLGEWRKRHSHRVFDRVEESRTCMKSALQTWVSIFGLDLSVKNWVVRREHIKFDGHLDIRATASISHDRFEKLCSASNHYPDDGQLPDPSTPCVTLKECDLAKILPETQKIVARAVEADSDIQEFIRFYDARLAEEVEHAGRTPIQRKEVARRYESTLAAELVGASGNCYATFEVEAAFENSNGTYSFNALLHIVPLTGTVLSEPARLRCDSTNKEYPESWLGDCAVSKVKVLLPLLETSALSNTTAVSKYFGTCSVTGRRLLHHVPEGSRYSQIANELGESDVSGITVGIDLLRISEVSGKRALENEMVKCEVTGALVLPDELERSGISGRMVRRDHLFTSPTCGVRGHRSEFRTCEETQALILEEEGGASDVSGRFVCKELLVSSEKNPFRCGLQSEMVKCSVTSRMLLADEAVKSAVSGDWVDKDEAVYSGVSNRPARRDEVQTCAITGIALLPDECGTSDVSGRIVDDRLLEGSQISGKRALKDEIKMCEFTGKTILSNEGIESDVSGKYVRLDEVAVSAISKLRGHTSELIRCAVTNDWLLPGEADKSDLSGLWVRPNLLRSSAKSPGRKGVDDEFVTCESTGRMLLRDEVARSEVTGKLVDRDLLVGSAVSGILALEEELITCEESGVRLHPGEAAVCSITGKRVDRRRLVRSELSGRLGVAAVSTTCDFTGRTVLVDEIEVSHVSGKKCGTDLMEASVLSGKRGYAGELVTCAISGQRLLPTEVGHSSMSNRIAKLDLLNTSEKAPGRKGFPDEFCVCASSEKRLLLDEVVKYDYSGRFVDRDLAVSSSASGRVGLPEEIILCEETGVNLLPDEMEVCSITGKRAARSLIGVSNLSGRRGLARLLQLCPITRNTGFADEFATCAVSKLSVAPSEIANCTVTGDTVLKNLLVQCSTSGRLLRRDKALISDKSGRLGHPDVIRICVWSGRRLLSDETRQCAITGLDFDRDLVPESSAAQPILDLLQKGVPLSIPTDSATELLRIALGNTGIKVRGLASIRAPSDTAIAYFVDCSGLFGFKKRHAVGFAAGGNEGRLLHPPCFGQFSDNSWHPDRSASV